MVYTVRAMSKAILVEDVPRCLALLGAAGCEARPVAVRVRLGSCTADLAAGRLCRPGGGLRRLTPIELTILCALVAARGRLVTHERLAAAICGKGFAGDDNSLYVHLSHLRAKLGNAGGLIRTRRGEGYVLL